MGGGVGVAAPPEPTIEDHTNLETLIYIDCCITRQLGGSGRVQKNSYSVWEQFLMGRYGTLPKKWEHNWQSADAWSKHQQALGIALPLIPSPSLGANPAL